MHTSDILISERTLDKIKAYHLFLIEKGIDEAGAYLQEQLALSVIPIEQMPLDKFTHAIVQSKIPKIFAESHVYHDKRDWTLAEESILGDMSVHIPVTFFNNGGHYNSFKNHTNPISANLAYVPGALLRSDLGQLTADLQEVVVHGTFDQARFNALYERRLLPELLHINEQAIKEGKLAAITLPGIGTGQFAGKHVHLIKAAFRDAFVYILTKHQDKLRAIDIVHYDPYSGDAPQSKHIGQTKFNVCPSSIMETTGQLAFPEGCSAKTHTLTSFVAWDHFSWPSNDFWPGKRVTDDGVKGASSNTMEVITGYKGRYDPESGSYLPPEGYANWQALAESTATQFDAPVFVVYPDGKKVSLSSLSAEYDDKKHLNLSYTNQAGKIDLWEYKCEKELTSGKTNKVFLWHHKDNPKLKIVVKIPYGKNPDLIGHNVKSINAYFGGNTAWLVDRKQAFAMRYFEGSPLQENEIDDMIVDSKSPLSTMCKNGRQFTMLDRNQDNFLRLTSGEIIPIDFDYMIVHDEEPLLDYQTRYLNGRKGFHIRTEDLSSIKATQYVLSSYDAAQDYLYEKWGKPYLKPDNPLHGTITLQNDTERREIFITDELLKRASDIITQQGLSNVSIIPRIRHYIPGDTEHNKQQPLNSIQFDFKSKADRDRVAQHLKEMGAADKLKYIGFGFSGQAIVQLKPSFFTASRHADAVAQLLPIEENKSTPNASSMLPSWLAFFAPAQKQDAEKPSNPTMHVKR